MGCSRSKWAARLGALATVTWLTGSFASAQPAHRSARQCFDLSRARGKVALDDRTLLVRVDGGAVMRIDLADQCPGLTRPDPRIILQARGSGFVCDRFDLSLSVGRAGAATGGVPCTVSAIRRLSAAEAAALPANRRP